MTLTRAVTVRLGKHTRAKHHLFYTALYLLSNEAVSMT